MGLYHYLFPRSSLPRFPTSIVAARADIAFDVTMDLSSEGQLRALKQALEEDYATRLQEYAMERAAGKEVKPPEDDRKSAIRTAAWFLPIRVIFAMHRSAGSTDAAQQVTADKLLVLCLGRGAPAIRHGLGLLLGSTVPLAAVNAEMFLPIDIEVAIGIAHNCFIVSDSQTRVQEGVQAIARWIADDDLASGHRNSRSDDVERPDFVVQVNHYGARGRRWLQDLSAGCEEPECGQTLGSLDEFFTACINFEYEMTLLPSGHARGHVRCTPSNSASRHIVSMKLTDWLHSDPSVITEQARCSRETEVCRTYRTSRRRAAVAR